MKSERELQYEEQLSHLETLYKRSVAKSDKLQGELNYIRDVGNMPELNEYLENPDIKLGWEMALEAVYSEVINCEE